MLHSKSITSKVTEGENIREPVKYIFAYIEDEKVDYISLALLQKEGEVTEIDHHKQYKGRSYMNHHKRRSYMEE